MAVAAFGLMTAAAAQAVTAQKATGSIRMGTGAPSNEKQAITFDVFETTPVKGNITYTNFELADPGSGVWVPAAITNGNGSLSLGSFDVQFTLDPSDSIASTYTFTVNSITPLTPTSLSFTANGVQDDAFGEWHGPVTGTINGSTINFTLLEENDNDPQSYVLNATGQIDGNGVVAGTWFDNYGGARTGKIAIADVGDETFSFTTTPTCVQVDPHVTKFGYTIPLGDRPYAGEPVAVRVTDNGSSGALNDSYQHNFATTQGTCEPRDNWYTSYPITAGNLTVFS
jgi:hypothetical protein